jgi:hypothetical protein
VNRPEYIAVRQLIVQDGPLSTDAIRQYVVDVNEQQSRAHTCDYINQLYYTQSVVVVRMTACLSLCTCWLPRTTSLQRVFLRSSFSTVSEPSTSSSHRSASRFSLKIARFLFAKNRLEPSASLSTHAHYTKSETPGDIHDLARDFVFSLEPGKLFFEIRLNSRLYTEEHRRILINELTEVEKSLSGTTAVVPILTSQLAVGTSNFEVAIFSLLV